MKAFLVMAAILAIAQGQITIQGKCKEENVVPDFNVERVRDRLTFPFVNFYLASSPSYGIICVEGQTLPCRQHGTCRPNCTQI